MKHRYLSGLLLILLLAQISCGSAADTPAVTTGTDTTQAASETTVTNAPELPERDYVAFLAREASEAAITGQEEVILSAKDRAGCGAKAVKAANELLAKRGLDGCLTLSDETRPMTGGLILKQGDIEVNCTVDTLLDLSRSELAARVAEVLFEG